MLSTRAQSTMAAGGPRRQLNQNVLSTLSPLLNTCPACYTFYRNKFCHTHSCNSAPGEVSDVIENVTPGESSSRVGKGGEGHGRWPQS
jgi:hypothetical protein